MAGASSGGGGWSAALERLVASLGPGPVDMRKVGPVLSACVRARQWTVAMALLELSSPGPIAYNSVANACEKSGHWQQALAVLAGMSTTRLELDSFSFCSMMSALAAGHKWPAAIHLHQELRDQSVELNTIVCSGAINACAKAGEWRMALEVLQSMAADAIPRNTVAFSSVLSACEKANEWTVALSLLGNMQEIHVSGDTISFSAAMSACEKVGQWTMALELFHQMQLLKLQVDTVSLSAVISATEKAAEWETAVGLLHQALTSWSLNVNSVTFAAAISACEKAEEWQMACALLRQLQQSKLPMDAFPFSAAMAGCSRVGQWQVALGILQQMTWFQVVRDTVSYTAAISACTNGREWIHGIHLLEAMSLEGLCHSDGRVFAYSAALSGLELAGKWQEALDLLRHMLQQSLPVDGITLGAVVGAVRRQLGEPAAVEQLKAISGALGSSEEDAIKDLPGSLDVIRHVPGLLVLNKASGVLTEDVLAQLRFLGSVTCISRLDAATSGVLPVVLGAELSAPARWFKAQFAGHLAKKEYLCLCHGSSPVGSIPQVISSPLRITEGANARAICDEHGREAVTIYKVLQEYRASGEIYSLVEAKPQTGRMHQIRAHMASLGHPIVGDRQYGVQRVSWCPRLFLHCRRLELLDWSTQHVLQLESPLPPELTAVLELLDSA